MYVYMYICMFVCITTLTCGSTLIKHRQSTDFRLSAWGGDGGQIPIQSIAIKLIVIGIVVIIIVHRPRLDRLILGARHDIFFITCRRSRGRRRGRRHKRATVHSFHVPCICLHHPSHTVLAQIPQLHFAARASKARVTRGDVVAYYACVV